jgi:hypothetical protein
MGESGHSLVAEVLTFERRVCRGFCDSGMSHLGEKQTVRFGVYNQGNRSLP